MVTVDCILLNDLLLLLPPFPFTHRPHSSREPTKMARRVSHGRKSTHTTHQPPTTRALTAPMGFAPVHGGRERKATRLKSAGWRVSSPVERETPRRATEVGDCETEYPYNCNHNFD